MTIRNKYNLIGIAALLICFAVIFFIRQKSHEEKIFLHAEPVQTGYGWGYNILANEKIYIKQEYMPGISGKHGFKTAGDALLVGNLVIHRISSNQMPMITQRDLDSLGLLPE
jgi:Domain of unknown function (DUF4907)